MSKNEMRIETIRISKKLLQTINSAIRVALKYEKAIDGKRKLGITGEIGEILVCNKLRLKLASQPRSEGFDAIDRYGKRVQIKTRRSEKEGKVNDAGRVSRFSKHSFDYALLCLLDYKYRIYEIWRASYKKLKPIIKREQNERRGPTIHSFKRVGKKIT